MESGREEKEGCGVTGKKNENGKGKDEENTQKMKTGEKV
jgi:hypothetical protein